MHRNQEHLAGFVAADPRRILVGSTGRLPYPSLLDREKGGEVIADPGGIQQSIGDLRGAVRESDKSKTGITQCADPTGDVRMDGKIHEACHHMLHGCNEVSVELDLGKYGMQRAFCEPEKVGLGT